MSEEKTRYHFFVSGRVQGVYYRIFTQQNANRMGLKGWVRNLSDGSVEILAEGNENELIDFESILREGPPSSKVVDLKIMKQKATNEFENFIIEKTKLNET
ncbi:MAG: acylphosphatase [Candidatus Ranarchaeia archaeon]